jgi:transcriptional regulator with XRE-family HTH domain
MQANEFKEWRKRMGLSQTQAAEALGYVSKSYISMMENGVKPVKPSIAKLANALEENIKLKGDL